MTSPAASIVPAIPHGPEISRAERLALLEAMTASRAVRSRVAAARRRGRMAPLGDPAGPGWEALEAAIAKALREDEILVAAAAWPAPLVRARRLGARSRLAEVVAAGLGATVGAPGDRAVAVLAGPGLRPAAERALASAVRRRAPLVVLVAAPGAAAAALRTAAGTAGAVFEQVSAAEVELITLAAESACNAARAGRGPTLIACPPAPAPRPRRPWEPQEPSADPIERYAARLEQLGIPASVPYAPAPGR